MPARIFLIVTLAEKITAVIQDRGLVMTRLAEAAGISYESLRRYAKPKSDIKPSAPTGIALAKALNVSIEWLFGDSDAWPPPPYKESPPFDIYPWPPDGITWGEVQYAIASYILDLQKDEVGRERGAITAGSRADTTKKMMETLTSPERRQQQQKRK